MMQCYDAKKTTAAKVMTMEVRTGGIITLVPLRLLHADSNIEIWNSTQ